MSCLRIPPRRFIRRLKSSIPMILLSLVISLVLNFYLLRIDSWSKNGSRQSLFIKKGRTFYDTDQEKPRGKSSFTDKVQNDVTDTQEDDYSQDEQDMNRLNDINALQSLNPPNNSVLSSSKSRDCSHIFFKFPRQMRNVSKKFTDSLKFHEITNITSYVPLHPLSKVRNFLQTRSTEINIEMFCDGIQKFEKQNNVSVRNFPQNLRYKLSLNLLRTMGYELKLPGAIIIGAKKGGTTALRFFLNFHPQIHAVRRELDFFHDIRKYRAGLDFYRLKFDFANSNQINMEKSPKYFTNKDVPQRIAESLGSGVKLILCIRDPVNRTISDFHHTSFLSFRKRKIKYQTSSSQSEGDRLVRSLFDEKGRLRSDNEFITPSLYSVHVKNWLKYFSMDQILIVQEEKFLRDLLKVLKEIESFLQIERFFEPSMFLYPRTCFIHNDVRSCSPRWGIELPKPHVNETVEQKLRDLFRPFNREFEEAVGQKFPWTNW